MTFFAAALLVALDQASKWWAKAAFEAGETLSLGLGFSLTYVRNTGAAFGMLRGLNLSLGAVTLDGTFLLGLLSAGVSVWLVVHLVRRGHEHGSWARAALVMVLAGALGNMIDRLRLGYVIDFVHFRVGWFDFPVFNVADVLVVSGAALLLLTTMTGPEAKRVEPDGDRPGRAAPQDPVPGESAEEG